MFAKLLKYDFRAIARVWWIVAVSVLGITVVGTFMFRFFLESAKQEENVLLAFFALLFVVICAVVIGASVLITMILVYLRFYKNLFTDEGYLTFTLPVSRASLLRSKTVNALIWMTLHTLLLIVCALFFLAFAVPPEKGGMLLDLSGYEALGNSFTQAWTACGAWMVLYAVEALLLCICYALYSISLVHFCITVGSVVAKKQKLLAAIGIYYLVNMASSFLSQMLVYAFAFLMEGFAEIFGVVEGARYYGAIGLLLLIACLIVAVIASVFYFTTRGMLERKLNLP